MNTLPIANASLEQQLEEVTELISLPEVYLKIRSLMDDLTSDIHDFARIFQLDPNLTASVLKLVNSAYFGFPQKIDSVGQAVNMIGTSQLHNMALSLSAISTLDYPNDIIPLKLFWRRSLFTGVLSQLLARHKKVPRSERLFVNGLLHEIGHLVLYAKFSEQAREAIQFAQTNELSIELAEQEVFGIHYGDIGAMLMANWGVSAEFQMTTSCQPNPQQATEYQIETGLLHLAHAYAYQQFAENDISADLLINPVAWEMTRLSIEDVDNTLEVAREVTADMERVLKL
jgi:HD-like signal output (HDOD) protein